MWILFVYLRAHAHIHSHVIAPVYLQQRGVILHLEVLTPRQRSGQGQTSQRKHSRGLCELVLGAVLPSSGLVLLQHGLCLQNFILTTAVLSPNLLTFPAQNRIFSSQELPKHTSCNRHRSRTYAVREGLGPHADSISNVNTWVMFKLCNFL